MTAMIGGVLSDLLTLVVRKAGRYYHGRRTVTAPRSLCVFGARSEKLVPNGSIAAARTRSDHCISGVIFSIDDR
nr:hypothetical protein CFP56_70556 [Quercus suber]